MNAIVSFWRLRLNWLKIFHLFICIATVGYIKFYGQNALSTKRSFNLSVSLLSVHLWSIKSGTSLKTNCSPDHGLEKIPHNSENIRAYHTLFRFAGRGIPQQGVYLFWSNIAIETEKQLRCYCRCYEDK